MKCKLSIFLLVIFGMAANPCFSQGLHTTSERALKKYNDGITAYDYVDMNKAENDFRAALSIDKKFYEAYIMLGELMMRQNRYVEASFSYRSAVKIDSLFFKPIFFNLANAEFMSGDYYLALTHYNVYLSQTGMSAANKAAAAKRVKNCEFALLCH